MHVPHEETPFRMKKHCFWKNKMPPTLQHNPNFPVSQDTVYRNRRSEQNVSASTDPIRVRLPDLYESSDQISGSTESAVINETTEHRHRHQLRRLARFLPRNRSQMVSLFTIGALLAGGTFLLAMTLRGNDASNQPQLNDAPAGWAQAEPPVEWSNQAFKRQPKPITKEKIVTDEKPLTGEKRSVYQQLSDIQIVDQQPLSSPWPREMRQPQHAGPGGKVAEANSSARIARYPMPDAADSVSPASYPQLTYPQRARVAELTGTIETTTEKQRRR